MSYDLRDELSLQGHLFLTTGRCVDQPDGSTNELLIKVGSRRLCVSFEVAPEPGVHFFIELYEAPTTTKDGTARTPRNMNRTSDNELLTTCFITPTVTDDGDLVFNYQCTGGGGGGGTHHNGLWVLSPNTNYLLRMTNESGAAADCGYSLQMHERG